MKVQIVVENVSLFFSSFPILMLERRRFSSNPSRDTSKSCIRINRFYTQLENDEAVNCFRFIEKRKKKMLFLSASFNLPRFSFLKSLFKFFNNLLSSVNLAYLIFSFYSDSWWFLFKGSVRFFLIYFSDFLQLSSIFYTSLSIVNNIEIDRYVDRIRKRSTMDGLLGIRTRSKLSKSVWKIASPSMTV